MHTVIWKYLIWRSRRKRHRKPNLLPSPHCKCSTLAVTLVNLMSYNINNFKYSCVLRLPLSLSLWLSFTFSSSRSVILCLSLTSAAQHSEQESWSGISAEIAADSNLMYGVCVCVGACKPVFLWTLLAFFNSMSVCIYLARIHTHT